MKKEYYQFKQLLEYFITHLEWAVNKSTNSRGYDTYIKPLLENNSFKVTGQGYNGDNIQSQIKDWEQYQNGKICINIQHNYGNYKSSKSYLNWEGTGINIIAQWDNNKIIALSQEHYFFWLKEPRRENLGIDKKIVELGLFDSSENVTEVLKSFYDNFNKHLMDYTSQQEKKKQMQEINPYIQLLENNHNLILTGAPGTGKTYLAKKIAKAMDAKVEFVQFHPSYDYTDFVEGLRPTPPDSNGSIGFELKNGIFKDFCEKAISTNVITSGHINQFNLDNYKTYLQDINLNDKTINIYINKIGQLLGGELYTKREIIDRDVYKDLGEICDNHEDIKDFDKKNNFHNQFTSAVSNLIKFRDTLSSQPDRADKKELVFIFIIDEINRGEISKVFGELFFSIDSGYRGKKGKVKTQYSNLQGEGDIFYDGFYIPENVYIIGTMNDIDRSVESFDFAMRRRFAWKEVKAPSSKNQSDISMWNVDIDGWRMSEETKKEAKKRIIALNDKIESIQGLGSAFHIGPAYFLKLRNYDEDFGQLWENHLKGVLFEYLRGLPDSEQQLIELENIFNLKTSTTADVESN